MNNLMRITLVIEDSNSYANIVKQILQHNTYSTDKQIEIKINRDLIIIQTLLFLTNTTLIELLEFYKQLSIDYKSVICVVIKDYDDLDWNTILFDTGQTIIDEHTPMLDDAREILIKHVGSRMTNDR